MRDVWIAITESIVRRIKKERYQKPSKNPWWRQGCAIFGSMMITFFAIPLFLLLTFPEALEVILSFVKSGAINWHIAFIVLLFYSFISSGISLILGLIASASIGDAATPHEVMWRGITITLVVFAGVGTAVWLAVSLAHRMPRVRT